MNARQVTHRADGRFRPLVARSDAFDVLDACHRRMLAATARLERLAALLGDGSERHDPVARHEAGEIAEFFGVTVRRHHEDEERHVFPPLTRSGDAQVVATLARLQQDHGWLEEDWLELEPHLQAVATGYGHCDVDVVRQGIPVFAALLREHIALEEALIYPAARTSIGVLDRAAMGREMEERRRRERARHRRR